MRNRLTTTSVLCLLFLQGCNTVEGIGADIKGTGSALETSAAEAKHDMSEHGCCHHCHKCVPTRAR